MLQTLRARSFQPESGRDIALPTSPTILRTDHLGRSVGEKLLVDNISVEVHEGEVLAVVGPSGAGKSSFRAFTAADQLLLRPGTKNG